MAGADRPFVCPWCGAKFAVRHQSELGRGQSLEDHWRANPECAANRNTNNPTQSKYDAVDRPAGLRLVDREDRDA